VEKCPQKIPIPERMKDVVAAFDEALRKLESAAR
jgi:predicted aldo/keto reductase-like oxidoreductase